MFHPPLPPQVPQAALAASESEEYLEATQQQTQPQTQQDSISDSDYSHLWGRLVPCATHLETIDLDKMRPTYSIGRAEGNDIVLRGQKISGKHCVITWTGNELEAGTIIVEDLSTNGTFINGVRVGKGRKAYLKASDELSLGAPQDAQVVDDYRFIFRKSGPSTAGGGVHAVYDMGHQLGRGSFATVCRALHRETGDTYACKMIAKSRFKGNEKTARMFERERSIMRGLKHPNIVSFKEDFEDESTMFFILEFIEGGDLLDYIVKHGPLTEDHTRPLAYQMCQALAYTHAKGITHRDLKPENVLLTATDPPIAKIADWGLAKAVDSQTFLKTMCGTPSYLAPEVLNDSGYTQVVDSWSLGVIIFSMLTSTSPFIEDSQASLQERMHTRTIEWSLLESMGLSPTGIHFLESLLQSDPQHRLSVTNALNHAWFSDLGPPNPPIADPVVPKIQSHGMRDREQTLSLDESATGSFLTAPQHPPSSIGRGTPDAAPSPRTVEHCSQEFEHLHILSSSDISNAATVGSGQRNGLGLGLMGQSPLVSKFSSADSGLLVNANGASSNGDGAPSDYHSLGVPPSDFQSVGVPPSDLQSVGAPPSEPSWIDLRRNRGPINGVRAAGDGQAGPSTINASASVTMAPPPPTTSTKRKASDMSFDNSSPLSSPPASGDEANGRSTKGKKPAGNGKGAKKGAASRAPTKATAPGVGGKRGARKPSAIMDASMQDVTAPRPIAAEGSDVSMASVTSPIRRSSRRATALKIARYS